MKVYVLIGITNKETNGLITAHCLLASYKKSSCEKKLKEIRHSHFSSMYSHFVIDEQSIKRTNDMIVKEMDDKIDFHNSMVRRGR